VLIPPANQRISFVEVTAVKSLRHNAVVEFESGVKPVFFPKCNSAETVARSIALSWSVASDGRRLRYTPAVTCNLFDVSIAIHSNRLIN